MSHAACHMSGVACCVSHVKFYFLFIINGLKLVCGGLVINVATPSNFRSFRFFILKTVFLCEKIDVRFSHSSPFKETIGLLCCCVNLTKIVMTYFMPPLFKINSSKQDTKRCLLIRFDQLGCQVSPFESVC